jgi:hypothetical protein
VHKVASPLPGRKEIEHIRGEIKAGKRRIVWKDTGDSIISENIKGEGVAVMKEPQPKRIILNTEPIDINVAPKAVKLISTKALVQDFIGVPYSLAFIR